MVRRDENARLAAKLTGYKIDIKPESEVEFVDDDELPEAEAEAAAETNDNADAATDAETTPDSDAAAADDADDAKTAADPPDSADQAPVTPSATDHPAQA